VTDIQRWKPSKGDINKIKMEIDPRGKYVRYADHLAVVQADARPASALWIPISTLPEVPLGRQLHCWVAIQRQRVVVRDLYYLNKPYDLNTCSGWELEGEDGELMDAVGWFAEGCNSSYDEFYVPVELSERIIAWMPVVVPTYAEMGRG
jgi:hypothetical protein